MEAETVSRRANRVECIAARITRSRQSRQAVGPRITHAVLVTSAFGGYNGVGLENSRREITHCMRRLQTGITRRTLLGAFVAASGVPLLAACGTLAPAPSLAPTSP